ncbi:MAG TPA: CHAT domain-containing protein [Blastocatellia bacterium]|nr:CHAT domain-containing protein [Blastocatellia bacterium]
MRTITLELLRHGVAHNQLLSPLTSYLALCENHAAVTLHLPFEHNQFLHRLRALGYKLQEESRLFQLQDTARTLGEILATIPGLTAESNRSISDKEALTHLRLIISASELALLPFELAISPNGLPGAGQHLLLQPQTPICLTREVRRVPGEQLQWPTKPRILFVAASPRGAGPIPVESHLLALRRVIRPWVRYYDSDDPQMRRKRVEEHLVFLPNASVEAIEDACATGRFTHVHILAHGIEHTETYDSRFYLALHQAGNPDELDRVSGARLATALRAALREDQRGLSCPAVVTLASCDSGNVGSVAGAGSSIAHALHEAGIPMVIASQFPLSFAGSVQMVEVLYDGFLCGEDPRLLLHDLRRRLHAQFPQTHDWSSLTAYATLPPDIDRQLEKAQIAQAKRGINAAFNHADEATRRAFAKGTTRTGLKLSYLEPTPTSDAETRKVLKNGQQKIEAAKRRLERLAPRIPSERIEILGLMASTEKRQAETVYSAKLLDQEMNPKESRELLRRAKDHYWQAFLQGSSWTLVQYLSLAVILKHFYPLPGDAPSEQLSAEANDAEKADRVDGHLIEDLWIYARVLSRNDLYSGNRLNAIWAHGNLIELYLLAKMLRLDRLHLTHKKADQLAQEHADELLASAERNSFEVYSTRRQIFRYVSWYSEIANIEPLFPLVEQIFAKFPEEVEETWK